jgi:hypothetical protein
MVRLTALLSDAVERTDRTLPLAVVPLVVSLLSVGKLRRIAGFAGANFGISFGFPSPVTAAWTFLSLPNAAGGVTISPGDPATFVLSATGVALLSAALGAGYLGSLRRAVAGDSRRFLADVRAHFPAFLAFQVGVLATTLAAIGLALVALPLVLVAIPVVLALAYLFYATPYLVVTGDRSILAALADSYAYATDGGAYASFFLRYLAGSALVSIVATPPFTSLGLPGALAGIVVLAPVGLLFDDATMAFVRDLDGAGGRRRGRRR